MYIVCYCYCYLISQFGTGGRTQKAIYRPVEVLSQGNLEAMGEPGLGQY